MNLIFMYASEEARTAARKAGFAAEISLPPGTLPTIGDLLVIEAGTGAIAFQVVKRAFHFSPGQSNPQAMSLWLGLVEDAMPPVRPAGS